MSHHSHEHMVMGQRSDGAITLLAPKCGIFIITANTSRKEISVAAETSVALHRFSLSHAQGHIVSYFKSLQHFKVNVKEYGEGRTQPGKNKTCFYTIKLGFFFFFLLKLHRRMSHSEINPHDLMKVKKQLNILLSIWYLLWLHNSNINMFASKKKEKNWKA